MFICKHMFLLIEWELYDYRMVYMIMINFDSLSIGWYTGPPDYD